MPYMLYASQLNGSQFILPSSVGQQHQYPYQWDANSDQLSLQPIFVHQPSLPQPSATMAAASVNGFFEVQRGATRAEGDCIGLSSSFFEVVHQQAAAAAASDVAAAEKRADPRAAYRRRPRVPRHGQSTAMLHRSTNESIVDALETAKTESEPDRRSQVNCFCTETISHVCFCIAVTKSWMDFSHSGGGSLTSFRFCTVL
jgi:hypothetical protein